ncbi:hypothetical protein FQN52_000060 [Onygenales sp. PD_12]|nr:hypothetical protein FQN52_000060 [Onygenales sp. PD_12]
MASPSPHHRHQSSLERILNFSPPARLTATHLAQAKSLFYRIIDHFSTPGDISSRPYKRPLLVRYTYEYARSETSRETFLCAFFDSMELNVADDELIHISWDDKGLEDKLRLALIEFSDFLFDNFYLPRCVAKEYVVKTSSKRTPQPSPAQLPAVQRALGGTQDYAGTPARISTLRALCLIRDRNARDEEGNPLLGQPLDLLEVAHILPHALMGGNRDLELPGSKGAALAILDMFDNGVTHLISGPEIDRPFNAISLAAALHDFFGNFSIFFEPVLDQQPHTYRIDTFLPVGLIQGLPVTRTLYITDDRTIDPPLPRLLAIHNAVGHILHLSAAGEYIDKVLSDSERVTQQDGSTELGRLASLRLGGWYDGTVDALT